MPQFERDGVEFNVTLDGPENAPPLMLSNSLGTNLHMWDWQIPELTKHFRVIRYDSRGHGKSGAPDGPYSIDDFGRDALAIMDALELDQVHWMGLSKGGMIGQWLLTHAPERIGRAVLANTGWHMPPPDLWNQRIRIALDKGMEELTPGVIERWFTPEFRAREPDTVEKIVRMLHTTPAHGYAGSCSAIRDMDQRESIRSVTNPVLVVVGSRDPATPPEMGKRIADTIRGARIVTLDAAHLSNIEQADAFNQAVIDFLTAREVAPARRAPPRHAAGRKPPRKPVASKAATRKRPAGKHAASKKAPAKKAAAKKSATKKTATKKTATKTRATKKSAAGRSGNKKAGTKKAAAKKSRKGGRKGSRK
ncbi:MAG: 3-oxoadipate enol-lactonase [Methylobacteriaceae bacterium]|nr:3-oxoadipate enol-lactonase [Methylobacteriaceae bacterium]